MVDAASNPLLDLVRHVGRYPEDAFLFVREGLTHASEKVHGPENDAHRALSQFLAENDLDWTELVSHYHEGKLPEELVEAVDAAGGCDKLNRHITSRDLCWGLRELALQRWGMLARTVLESWNVKSTKDFGKIVFGFIDLELMRKQPEDRLEDFDDVFEFRDAFDNALSSAESGRTGRDRR